ncbi:hypothetical protein [Thiopseudomonas denitrificans]|uniref:hypothetical protein n=1 Tax=Thiopseudomonas denitrificans TaxID=1501432 RepID=UPI001414ECE8|nr:hypothetical protein [Thiopseudomonas denitrificans]
MSPVDFELKLDEAAQKDVRKTVARSNATIELYRWRKFTGIAGRQAKAAEQADIQPV